MQLLLAALKKMAGRMWHVNNVLGQLPKFAWDSDSHSTQPEVMLNMLLRAHVLGLRYRFARFRPRVTKQRRLQATQAQTLDRVEHFRVLVGACHDLADLCRQVQRCDALAATNA